MSRLFKKITLIILQIITCYTKSDNLTVIEYYVLKIFFNKNPYSYN